MLSKEQFCKILIEEGIKDPEFQEALWKARPDNTITEEELREGTRSYLKGKELMRRD